MLAIAAGRCEVALIGYASRQRSRRNRKRAISLTDGTLAAQFEAPYGIHFPIGHYALSAARHMHQYGTTLEQLAAVAVAARQWARLNPQAWSRDPLSIDDVMASPMICDPLRKLDCCLLTDGGGVIVMSTEGRGRGLRRRGPAGARRLAALDDVGRRAVLQSSRRAGDPAADRGGAPAARRGRRSPGARCRDRRRPWHRRPRLLDRFNRGARP